MPLYIDQFSVIHSWTTLRVVTAWTSKILLKLLLKIRERTVEYVNDISQISVCLHVSATWTSCRFFWLIFWQDVSVTYNDRCFDANLLANFLCISESIFINNQLHAM